MKYLWYATILLIKKKGLPVSVMVEWTNLPTDRNNRIWIKYICKSYLKVIQKTKGSFTLERTEVHRVRSTFTQLLP